MKLSLWLAKPCGSRPARIEKRTMVMSGAPYARLYPACLAEAESSARNRRKLGQARWIPGIATATLHGKTGEDLTRRFARPAKPVDRPIRQPVWCPGEGISHPALYRLSKYVLAGPEVLFAIRNTFPEQLVVSTMHDEHRYRISARASRAPMS